VEGVVATATIEELRTALAGRHRGHGRSHL
jgi:hypothetical protein